ncbi:MAG: class I SAM-dependent methyltransferase [Candidatus Dojkabacteria bacterium]
MEKKQKGDWEKEVSEIYRRISQQLPSSNFLAIDVLLHGIAKVNDKKVLDVGSYLGDSSLRILQAGAREVYGVDIRQDWIEKSNKSYANIPNINFGFIDKDKVVSGVTSKYELAIATFVHPVISDVEELKRMFANTAAYLAQGASLYLLSLSPKSFFRDKGQVFRHYNHGLPKSGVYRSGEMFPNSILTNNGDLFEFYDTCWESDYLENLAKEVGFRKLTVHEISASSSSPLVLGSIDSSILKTQQITGVDYKGSPELEIPLYEVIQLSY